MSDDSVRRPLITHTLDVRWGDMDALGHVNNSHYFTYFEQARVAWLATLGPDFVTATVGPVLADARCTFKRPVVYPATVEIRVLAEPPGRSSLRTHYELRVVGDETVYATGEATVVWIDFATGRPVSLPDAIRTKLTGGDA